VSARRVRNGTTWLRVNVARAGEVRIRDNFGGRAPQWNRDGARKAGDDFVFDAQAGEVIEATLPEPTTMPPAPADVFLDDVPKPPKHPGVPMRY
jgi:hypothetical protein